MRLFYREPAKRWEETLPVGNGKLGGMVWGTVDEERIGLNEGTIWSGYPRASGYGKKEEALRKIRQMIFGGAYSKGDREIENELLGEFTESYLPFGELVIRDRREPEECQNYERELSLDQGMVFVRYNRGAAGQKRTVFASYPAKAILFSWESKGEPLKLEITMESPLEHEITADGTGIYLEGQCPEHVDPNYLASETPILQGSRGRKVVGACRVLECDGEVKGEGRTLYLHGASRIVLSFQCQAWNQGEQEKNLDDLEGSLEEFEKAHLADYQKLYQRVELCLGEDPGLPTDQRLKRLKEGEEDPDLYALYYQYGRYLLISSSRKGGMPANLQGIWNWMMRPPWSSNYTTNINVEMNYWPALSGGLPECLEPYFALVEDLAEAGEETAKAFGCRGFCVNHNTDFWRRTNPVGKGYGRSKAEEDSAYYAFFPLAGLWMCQEFYRYYEYTGDREFLEKRAYPVVKKAALFALDWLVPFEGFYVTCPSASPENGFLTENRETAHCAYASTIDMTLIREIFGNFKSICQILEREDELLEEISRKESRLYPYQKGRCGELLEWCKEFEEIEPGHRHLSHLYGMFPGELFEKLPQWKDAVRASLERRLEHGGGHTGWSAGWIINLFAVLGDGEKAYEYLKTLLTRSTYPNLWDDCPPFQIDGNFGGAAGIANMLVQDRGGEIKLLPAIPASWKNGKVRGLRVKGGKAVDITWKEGEVTESRVYSLK